MLVMVADDLRRVFRSFEFGRRHDFLADLGVGLHDLPFGIVELRRLQQDVIGDADLADIVERCGDAECQQLVGGQAAGNPDRGREALHPFRMQLGQPVAVAERDGQRFGVGVEGIECRVCSFHVCLPNESLSC